MHDETKTIIVNTKAYDKVQNAELRALLKYLCSGQVEDTMTEMIDKRVRMQELQDSVLEYLSLLSPHEMDIREEAIYQNKCETAKAFLAMGLSIEQVAQGTGLTIEEIAQLE